MARSKAPIQPPAAETKANMGEHYKEYDEYKLEVKHFTKPVPGAGPVWSSCEMKVFQPKLRGNIRVEQKTVDQLNKKMQNRNLILIESGQPVPLTVIRKWNTEGEDGQPDYEVNGGYADTYNYPATA